MTATATLICPNVILNEELRAESDESGGSVKDPVLAEKGNNNDNKLIDNISKTLSSSGHTDSENEAITERMAQRVNQVNRSVPPKPSSASKREKILRHKFPLPTTPISKRACTTPPSLSLSQRSRNKKGARLDHTSSEDSDTDDNENRYQESYIQYKLRRKNLIKIERLTDSDSRSRDKMRRHALSPPSSSDEENLHIGFVAYPIASYMNFKQKNHRSRHRPLCACIEALKCVFSPVTKVCHLCRNNKVRDSATMQTVKENGI